MVALTHLRFRWLGLTVHWSESQFSQLLVDGPDITVLGSKVSVFDLEQSLDFLGNSLGLASESEDQEEREDHEKEQVLGSLSSSVESASVTKRTSSWRLRTSWFAGWGC